MTLKQLEAVCKRRDIRIFDYNKSEKLINALGQKEFSESTSAYATQWESKRVIFHTPDLNEDLKFLTIAHELGHHVLGHLNLRNKFLWEKTDRAEDEANIFACVLTAFSIISEIKEQEKELVN